jgi:hypothetical protein
LELLEPGEGTSKHRTTNVLDDVDDGTRINSPPTDVDAQAVMDGVGDPGVPELLPLEGLVDEDSTTK